MDRLRVEDLAQLADVSVDTIRFYQKRRLLPAPAREGRVAWYGPEHVERLARIRELQAHGLTLALIGRVVSGDLDATDAPLAIAVLLSRQLVREAAELPEADGWRRTNELAVEIFASGDAVEGATAFAEKRKPVWKST